MSFNVFDTPKTPPPPGHRGSNRSCNDEEDEDDNETTPKARRVLDPAGLRECSRGGKSPESPTRARTLHLRGETGSFVVGSGIRVNGTFFPS
jgi:hypothetical protein